jgi:hypothetical protein
MAAEYQLDRADASGAHFTIDHGERLFMVYGWLAPAGLLTVFAVQTLMSGEAADRIYAYGLFAMAAACAGVTAVAARRPQPPAVLHFDNVSRTLRFEDGHGRVLSSVPYAEVGPFSTGRHSDGGADGRGRTYHTIRVTLRDGRVLPLGGNTSEPTRDEQLATLRRCVLLPSEADAE